MDKFQLFCAFCFFAGFAWLCNSQVEENPLIVGGDFVDIKDHAHHLGMFNIQSSQPGSFFCGAVNINRLWAISAAHCVVNIAATAVTFFQRFIKKKRKTKSISDSIVWWIFIPFDRWTFLQC